MIVGIHQPHYYPWIGYFDKMAQSDTFILLDEVQMEKGSFMYRNRILNQQGKIVYLTISGDKHGFIHKKYREIKSKDDELWLRKHKDEIKRSYGNSPYFNEIWAEIGDLFETYETTICAYCIRSILRIKQLLGIESSVVLQSDLKYDQSQRKNDLVIELCKAVGATAYLSGNGARKYADEQSFTDAAIALSYQRFEMPEYPQMNSSEFVPGLSVLDLLFNCGIEKSKEVFWKTCDTGVEPVGKE